MLLTQSGLLGTSESEELELMNGKTSDVGSNWLYVVVTCTVQLCELSSLRSESGHTSFSFEFARVSHIECPPLLVLQIQLIFLMLLQILLDGDTLGKFCVEHWLLPWLRLRVEHFTSHSPYPCEQPKGKTLKKYSVEGLIPEKRLLVFGLRTWQVGSAG